MSNSVLSQDHASSDYGVVSSDPIVGQFTANGTSDTFVAVPGRNLWVSLTGTFNATVTLMRSIDNGTTWAPITVGGSAYGVFTGPVQEALTAESESGVQYRLDCRPFVSGPVPYRIGHR